MKTKQEFIDRHGMGRMRNTDGYLNALEVMEALEAQIIPHRFNVGDRVKVGNAVAIVHSLELTYRLENSRLWFSEESLEVAPAPPEAPTAEEWAAAFEAMEGEGNSAMYFMAMRQLYRRHKAAKEAQQNA